jgi:two-component system chemotaxis response regulator CheB
MRDNEDNKDVIVIGASAGGVEALRTLVRGLPKALDAAVFVVLHMPASGPSRLAEILQRCSALPVVRARDGETIRRGHVYVARPDYHLTLEEETMRLTRGPRENRHRPAIDALFRSAAYTHGGRVIGVVLTGELDDGTAGLWSIEQRGGTAVVQDPEDAESPSMPRNALQYVRTEHVLPVALMGARLAKLTLERRGAGDGPGDQANAELFERKAMDTQRRADLVRQATLEHQTLSKDNIAEVEEGSR